MCGVPKSSVAGDLDDPAPEPPAVGSTSIQPHWPDSRGWAPDRGAAGSISDQLGHQRANAGMRRVELCKRCAAATEVARYEPRFVWARPNDGDVVARPSIPAACLVPHKVA
jgi:hypothetical protein